jgi:type II secretory pathway predicted ATPase ExeA
VATDIVLQAAAALHAAHRSGIIHRDVKPANLLVGAGGVTKLGDFGMALGSAELSAGNAHVRVGTPYYTAPEIWTGGAATPASDVYSLGATYFHLLTGKPPFPGSDVAAVEQAHLRVPAPDPRRFVPTLPASCAALVARALAKDPKDRQGSAMVLLWEARRVLQDLAAGAPSPLTPVAHADPELGISLPPPPEDLRGPPPSAPQALRRLGFARRPFFDAAPRALEEGWEPLASARARLLELLDLAGAPVIALTGAPAQGHAALCRRVTDALGHDRLALFLHVDPAAADRALLQNLCRIAGTVVEETSDEACLDALVERLSEERQHRNRVPLVVLAGVQVPHPSTAGLARVVEASRASGAFQLALVGAPGLAAALERCRVTPGDARVPELQLPPLERDDIARYVRSWIDATLAPRSPPLVFSRDAVLLLALRSEGALDRIDHLCENMLVLAASERRRALGAWDAWSASDHARWATRPPPELPHRPQGWPPPEVADVIDACRRGAGMPPWPRAAGRSE